MSTEAAAAPAADDGGLPADMVTEDRPQAPDATEFARRLGWKPKEEFGGDVARWQDADTYVKRTMEELPAAKARIKFQDEFIQKQQNKIDEIERRSKETGDSLKELLNRDNQREERGYAWAREQIKQRQRQAVADADTAAYERAERDLEDLEKSRTRTAEPPKKQDDPPKQQAADPAVAAWVSDNPWFNTDKRLHREAIAIESSLAEEEPHLTTADRLKKTKDELVKRYPDKLGNAARNRPPTAAQPTGQTARPNGGKPKEKTVADLDEGARAALAKLKRMNPQLTDKEYLATFKWDK